MSGIGVLVSIVLAAAAGGARHQASRPAAAPSTSEGRPTVGFYFLAEARMRGPQAKKQPLEDLKLADKPLLTGKDILFYDDSTCRLVMTFKATLDICKAWPRDYLAPALRPVVVVVRGKRRFLGAISGVDPGLTWAELRRSRDDLAGRLDRFRENLAVVRLQSPWDAEGEDSRQDPVFLAALRDRGALADRVWGVRPKRTRKEVARLAAEARLVSWGGEHWWLPGRDWGPAPELSRVRTVTFCRNVVVTTPSRNIIGLDGPAEVTRAWVVAFRVPAGRAAGGPGWSGRHWPWGCLVDDTTGEVRVIHPPLYVRSVSVAGTDPLPARPVASEGEVRKVAAQRLESIARVRFIESGECLPLAETGPVWIPVSRFWLCEGTDAKDETRQLILTDRIPHYRGPEVWWKGDRFKFRRLRPGAGEDAGARQRRRGPAPRRPATSGTSAPAAR